MSEIIYKENHIPTKLNILQGTQYEVLYPKTTLEQVFYNKNSIERNGVHIPLGATDADGKNAKQVLDILIDRLSTGGRKFERTALSNVKDIVYYKGKYYALVNSGNISYIYSITNSGSVIQEYISDSTSTKPYINCLTYFNNTLYGATIKNGRIVVSSFYQGGFISEYTSPSQYNISGDIYICSDSCSIIVAGVTADTPIVIAIMGSIQNDNSLLWEVLRETTTHSQYEKINLNYDNRNHIVNVGMGRYMMHLYGGLYYMDGDILLSMLYSVSSMSNYDTNNQCVYVIKNNQLLKIQTNNDYSTIKLSDNVNIGKNYDLTYADGKYIFNIYNKTNEKESCMYGIKPYNNTLYQDGMYIMEQPLVNLKYAGSYIFGIGANDGKLYRSKVK